MIQKLIKSTFLQIRVTNTQKEVILMMVEKSKKRNMSDFVLSLIQREFKVMCREYPDLEELGKNSFKIWHKIDE